jgi:hypothetical protein
VRPPSKSRYRLGRGAFIGIAAVFGIWPALTAIPVSAYGATMAVSIPSTMTLSRSYAEVEFPVTVTCDPIGAYDSYVYVNVAQSQTGATGSQSIRPLTCDSQPHTYLAHVFADNTPFQDGPAAATAFAENIAQNFVQQSGSASTTTNLDIGRIAVPAIGITSSTTGSTYSVSIGAQASLKGQIVNGNGFGEAIVEITVTCTPPTTSYSPWIGAALEQGAGSRLVVGYDDQYAGVQQPTLICDGKTHTYKWTLSGSASTAPYDGILPGDLSVVVWVEGDYSSPQWSAGARNGDAVATVHAPAG